MNVRRAASSDLAAVTALVAEAGLPTTGLSAPTVTILIAEDDDGAVVGTAAIEVFGESGLLRSVAVQPARRGTAIGSGLVSEAVAVAASSGLRDLWLLTEGAAGFFSAGGWQPATREDLPRGMQMSPEYTAHCSDAAAVMVRELDAP
jgi:amino-acid N-acetyltransferase